jgi:hypothetical protein
MLMRFSGTAVRHAFFSLPKAAQRAERLTKVYSPLEIVRVPIAKFQIANDQPIEELIFLVRERHPNRPRRGIRKGEIRVFSRIFLVRCEGVYWLARGRDKDSNECGNYTSYVVGQDAGAS